ncbi:hypothetical protein POM88_005744 [Heracleum sosnowskyi]|uniref:Uncharacterized protein n=1 Tax=Heracleum sosnowskyi TaxID=360622 RepID=A0AAD8N4Q1_9APIA|nr:hypothetical protein POM88_005744 [Heracleum sosnowskyi]
METPVPTPSKVVGASASVDRSTSSRKREFPHTPGASHASGSPNQKKPKQMTLKSPQSSVSVTSKNRFLESMNDNVSDSSVYEWDKMSLAEAAPVVTNASSQCLFFFLKYGGELVEATRGDARACEEVVKLKAEAQTRKEERKKLLESNRKLFASETALIKEREKLLKEQEKRELVILKVDKTRDDMESSYVKKVNELKAQVKALKASPPTLQNNKSDEDSYETGYATGIRYYMTSTYEVFPNLEWALLGHDAVDSTGSGDDAENDKDKEEENIEVEARVVDATLEIPPSEPQSVVLSTGLDAAANRCYYVTVPVLF